MHSKIIQKSILATLLVIGSWGLAQDRPNVVFVLIDDVGIGDLACLGNPWIHTPNIDAFYNESVRLTDFHVSPMCTPTRGAIITGQYPINNGVWATYKGRDNLSRKSPKIAQLFHENGYTTGMFGKWHLGDNYPSRPMDCGFDRAVYHKSGGADELSNYWGNNYFDDTYFINGKPKTFKGYCTEIWFDEAMNFIKEQNDQKKPFFVYLATNLAHTPLYIDDKYVEPYKDLENKKIPKAKYYGMIANIDENMGRLERFLEANNLKENTIVIFASDNGSASGYRVTEKLGYNGGYRGTKGHIEEGGHRDPFFIRWPQKGIQGGKDITQLAAHVDIFPTLAGLCGFDLPKKIDLDGVDLSPLLLGKKKDLSSRKVFVHFRQDYLPPLDLKNASVLQNNWRLINGNELYNIAKDSLERNNVFQQYPEITKSLLAANEAFVKRAKQREQYRTIAPTVIGSPKQEVISLTIQHAVGDDGPIWKQEDIAAGKKNKNDKYAIEVETNGKYRISCMRWPEECDAQITGIPKVSPIRRFGDQLDYKAIFPEKAEITIFDKTYEKSVRSSDNAVVFEISLKKGTTMLLADFLEQGEKYGVNYITIEKITN